MLFILFLLSCGKFFKILDMNILLNYDLIFPHFISFHLSVMFNEDLLVFFLCCLHFALTTKSSLPRLKSEFCACISFLSIYSFISDTLNILNCICYKTKVQVHSFACGYNVFLTPFAKENVLAPLYIFGTLIKVQLISYACACFVFLLFALICVFVFMVIFYCFDYCRSK